MKKEKIYIFDTTLRDGAQTQGVDFSIDDKEKIALALDALGVDYIEGGWPGSNDRDEGFFNKVQNERYTNSTIVAFGSTRRAKEKCDQDTNIQSLLNANTSAITIVGKTWDFHVSEALKITNKKLPYASVWKDDKWIVKDKKQDIQDMVDKSYNKLMKEIG